MTTTNLTSLELSKLTAVLTGGGYKRAASKDAAIARFLKAAEEKGVADAAKLLGGEFGFDTAHHLLGERIKGGHASISEALSAASLIEEPEHEEVVLRLGEETSEGKVGRWRQTGDGPVWTARSSVGDRGTKNVADWSDQPVPSPEKAPRKESKTAELLRLAQTPEGITNARMKELTGWTKLGGFFNAAKKAGLELTRVRENGDTTWRVIAKAE